MLQKLKVTEILLDVSISKAVEGTIKKICIKTKMDLSNVLVLIRTSDKEVLFRGSVMGGQIIYPKNIRVIDNVVCKEDIILMGGINIEVAGMIEGDRIDEISFIIDTDRDKLRETY